MRGNEPLRTIEKKSIEYRGKFFSNLCVQRTYFYYNKYTERILDKKKTEEENKIQIYAKKKQQKYHLFCASAFSKWRTHLQYENMISATKQIYHKLVLS